MKFACKVKCASKYLLSLSFLTVMLALSNKGYANDQQAQFTNQLSAITPPDVVYDDYVAKDDEISTEYLSNFPEKDAHRFAREFLEGKPEHEEAIIYHVVDEGQWEVEKSLKREHDQIKALETRKRKKFFRVLSDIYGIKVVRLPINSTNLIIGLRLWGINIPDEYRVKNWKFSVTKVKLPVFAYPTKPLKKRRPNLSKAPTAFERDASMLSMPARIFSSYTGFSGSDPFLTKVASTAAKVGLSWILDVNIWAMTRFYEADFFGFGHDYPSEIAKALDIDMKELNKARGKLNAEFVRSMPYGLRGIQYLRQKAKDLRPDLDVSSFTKDQLITLIKRSGLKGQLSSMSKNELKELVLKEYPDLDIEALSPRKLMELIILENSKAKLLEAFESATVNFSGNIANLARNLELANKDKRQNETQAEYKKRVFTEMKHLFLRDSFTSRLIAGANLYQLYQFVQSAMKHAGIQAKDLTPPNQEFLEGIGLHKAYKTGLFVFKKYTLSFGILVSLSTLSSALGAQDTASFTELAAKSVYWLPGVASHKVQNSIVMRGLIPRDTVSALGLFMSAVGNFAQGGEVKKMVLYTFSTQLQGGSDFSFDITPGMILSSNHFILLAGYLAIPSITYRVKNVIIPGLEKAEINARKKVYDKWAFERQKRYVAAYNYYRVQISNQEWKSRLFYRIMKRSSNDILRTLPSDETQYSIAFRENPHLRRIMKKIEALEAIKDRRSSYLSKIVFRTMIAWSPWHRISREKGLDRFLANNGAEFMTHTKSDEAASIFLQINKAATEWFKSLADVIPENNIDRYHRAMERYLKRYVFSYYTKGDTINARRNFQLLISQSEQDALSLLDGQRSAIQEILQGCRSLIGL